MHNHIPPPLAPLPPIQLPGPPLRLRLRGQPAAANNNINAIIHRDDNGAANIGYNTQHYMLYHQYAFFTRQAWDVVPNQAQINAYVAPLWNNPVLW